MIKLEDLKNMNYEVRELVVLEALLRRISLVNMPFVLKGSLLTRQYLENPDIRYVNDIDFLYLGKIKDEEHARETFTNWMIQVTEMDLLKCFKLIKETRVMLEFHEVNTSWNKALDDSDQRIYQSPLLSTIKSVQETINQDIQRKKHKDKYDEPYK